MEYRRESGDMSSEKALYTVIEGCRSCGGRQLEDVLDLGITPLADRLVTDATLAEPEPFCPLSVAFCPSCGLLQIRETVDPEVLFGSDYPYYSSVSPALMAHFRSSVEAILARRALGPDSLVVELASNDGCQLLNYVEHGIPVLGIDPAEGPARRAIERGVDTRIAFFTQEYAEGLVAEGVRADVVHANNVIAHVADTNGFVAGIALLLADDGEAVIECPYVKDLVDHCEFDTIYHQHLCYFSVSSLSALFERHGLYLNRVERTPIHGGSLRVFVEREHRPDESVHDLLELERSEGLDRFEHYARFGARVEELRGALRELLDGLKQGRKRVVGYGAAAKGCTLMSFVGIDAEDLEYVVDLNPFKHGRYLPGTHIPIRPAESVAEDAPDYLLLLAWNFADEIMAQQSAYASRGGRFVVPVPQPRIV